MLKLLLIYSYETKQRINRRRFSIIRHSLIEHPVELLQEIKDPNHYN